MAKKSANAVLASPDDDWRAKDDLRTLTEAHGIMGDRSRFRAARAHGLKQLKSLGAVTSLGGRGSRRLGS